MFNFLEDDFSSPGLKFCPRLIGHLAGEGPENSTIPICDLRKNFYSNPSLSLSFAEKEEGSLPS